MSVNIQTGNSVKIQSGNRVLISAPGPQGPAGGGAEIGGSDTQVQFNDGGDFGGNSRLTFDKTTGVLAASHIHGNLAGSLYVHVKNTSGGALTKGTPVYATGSVGASGEIEVAAADFTNSAKMPAIGILDADLAVNAEGNAVVAGEVTGLATNSYSINQELFVGTAGLVGTLPTTGEAQSIAIVSRVHASTGIIVINTQGKLNAALRALANNNGASLTGIPLTTGITGTLPVANGGTGATTLTANNVLLGNGTSALQTVAPSTTGNVLTSNGTTWTSAAPTTGANPAGSGSELQFRSSGTAFGALTSSSVSGANLTLGNAESLGTTPTAYLTLRNTTAAAAGAQQVSPSLVLEGQGWKTTAAAASQSVQYHLYTLPVQGTTNPTADLVIASSINGGAVTERMRITSTGQLFPVGNSSAGGNFSGSGGECGLFWGTGRVLGITSAFEVRITNDAGLSFSPSNSTADLWLRRDAAQTLAQRNGTNAQTFRLYETDSGANDEYLEFSAASGTNLIRPQATGTGTASVVRYHTTTAVFWTSGSGSPESVVTAPIGSLYTRTDGGASTTLYVKESGTGSTGWVAK